MFTFNRVQTRGSEESHLDILNLCKYLPSNTVMAEVGSYAGDSACLFLSSGKVSVINCIDPWENDYDGNDICSFTCPMKIVENEFDKQIKAFKDKNVVVNKIKKYSVDASNDFVDNSLDFVYIDACHTYENAKEDLLAWIPKIKKGGFIGGHDFIEMFTGVKKAIVV